MEETLTLYGQAEAAEILDQHPFTVRIAIRRGDIPVYARTARGFPLMTLETLLAYQKRRQTDPRFAHAIKREQNRKARTDTAAKK